MDPNDVPTPQAQPDLTNVMSAAPIASAIRPTGFRRTVLTAGMAAALLIAGGAAVVTAASPDPSATPTPVTTTDPSADGSTAPSSSATPGRGSHVDCPNMDGQSGTPSGAPTPTPAATPAS